MRFWIHSRRTCTRKSKSHHQARIGAKDPWAIGKNRVKWKDRQGTARNLPKTDQKDAKVTQRSLQSADNTDENGKNRSQKVLALYQDSTLRSARADQSAKHVLTECRAHTRKRNRTWEEDRRKAAFGRISWEEMLTQPKFAKKAAQFMKSLRLIDQFKSVTLD